MPRKRTGDSVTEGFSVRVPSGLREFIEWDVAENKEHVTRNEWAIEHYKAYRVEQIAKTKQINASVVEAVSEESSKKGRA